ncbi:MAG: ZIP family metal transporter [Patescibacteria group bacterium]|nr:ZIP family metal transporter [Patescibacteria group bacterium]
MIFIIALATICSTFLGGLFAIRFKDKLHLILGFSAGAVIGVAFFDLLPESITLATKSYTLELTVTCIAIGFVVFLILDRLFSLHLHEDNDCQKSSHRGKIAAATLAFHSFLDGLGIGLAFKISPTIGWIVAAGVLAHDFSDGINTVNMILKNRGKKNETWWWLTIDALAPALGVIMAMFLTISESTLGLILAIFTGFFLYIGASDLIPESHHRHPTIWTTIMTVCGIVVLYLAVRFAG